MRQNLLKPLTCFLASICCINFLSAQENIAANNAYIITCMAAKYHVQPRPVDDSFSADVFNQLLQNLDEDKIYFTQKDINTLAKYKFDIDDEIKNKQPAFLDAVTKIFKDRITEADSLIDDICKKPFNFSLSEKISDAEDTSFPADDKAARIKLYKNLKAEALDIITNTDSLTRMSPQLLKKFVDSIEPEARAKAAQSMKHAIDIILKSAAGVPATVGNEYCKAIAVCYDPHSEYFPLTEEENFESELGQDQMVFGFRCKEEDDGSVKIESIMPGSPAFKSGQMNKGDKFISVQWENKLPIDVSNAGLKQFYEVLEMSNHDKATFKIKKPDGTVRTVVLMKQKMQDDDDENRVKGFLLKGSKTIGFISLPAFYADWEDEGTGVNGCANDVAKEILKLEKENIQGLIIDLRYNGGGSIQEAVELSGIFIDIGPVGMYKDRDEKIYTLKDVNRGTIYDGPLMIMVNGYTASAAEMVAGTLQDYHRAVIIGSDTYGKATAQVVLPMDTTLTPDKDPDKIKTDSYFKVTISELYRVTGNTAQAKGIEPDIVLPDIPELHPQREVNNLHVLTTAPIDGNKYFQPYPAINISGMKSLADREVNTSPFFQKLKSYATLLKDESNENATSLRLSDLITEQKEEEEKNISDDTTVHIKSSYTVDNNSFDKAQMLFNDDEKEVNAQWIKYLNQDPWLAIAYDAILLMTK